ncbi:VOC family protein [Segeticoccus rhizosphaerae]|jgi:uncharacterized glyoxalase superfamily protein PhnB|uniref:VOC family protein n=1 Tax=Segeticoccus rhizosphaerae TaxID=1104777 RepID=UPI001264C25A
MDQPGLLATDGDRKAHCRQDDSGPSVPHERDRREKRYVAHSHHRSSSVVPELVYADVEQAIDWLCRTFGFTESWRAGGHRARLGLGSGVLILADTDPQHGRASPKPDQPRSHSIAVKVDNVDAHHSRARQHGARILSPPADYPYGERQYSVEDLAGHRWTFTEVIADVLPEDWGGTSSSTLTDSCGQPDGSPRVPPEQSTVPSLARAHVPCCSEVESGHAGASYRRLSIGDGT